MYSEIFYYCQPFHNHHIQFHDPTWGHKSQIKKLGCLTCLLLQSTDYNQKDTENSSNGFCTAMVHKSIKHSNVFHYLTLISRKVILIKMNKEISELNYIIDQMGIHRLGIKGWKIIYQVNRDQSKACVKVKIRKDKERPEQ